LNFQTYPAEAPLKTCPEESPMKACPEEDAMEAMEPWSWATSLQPQAEHRRHLSMQMRNVNSD